MCGIIAGIYENIFLVLLAGLQQLQNRGYDSAGISLFNAEKQCFELFKKASISDKSAINFLEEYAEQLNTKELNNYIGIGHNAGLHTVLKPIKMRILMCQTAASFRWYIMVLLRILKN